MIPSTPTQDRLYYVHDPMCSWCWGYRPTWEAIQAALPTDIYVVYLVGGLAPDSDEPMLEDMRFGLQQVWKKIELSLGRPFNHDFWSMNTPRRSTYPACRAVLAAEALARKGKEMIFAIQTAYYQQARNPSDIAVLSDVAMQIGIDGQQLRAWILDEVNEKQFQRELAFAHSLPISGFPSLVLETQGTRQGIALDYLTPQVALDDIARKRAMV